LRASTTAAASGHLCSGRKGVDPFVVRPEFRPIPDCWRRFGLRRRRLRDRFFLRPSPLPGRGGRRRRRRDFLTTLGFGRCHSLSGFILRSFLRSFGGGISFWISLLGRD
jgi:hypothetical protein